MAPGSGKGWIHSDKCREVTSRPPRGRGQIPDQRSPAPRSSETRLPPDPLEAAEWLQAQGGAGYTPTNAEQLLRAIGVAKVMYLNSALQLQEALRRDYPTIQGLKLSLLSAESGRKAKGEVRQAWRN